MAVIPDSFAHMLAAWNTRDASARRALLAQALDPAVEFTDPNFKVTGIAAFDAMIAEFHERVPGAECVRTSAIDLHHDRARYSWRVVIDADNGVDGFDAVALAPDGKIARIDGYFGPLQSA